MVVAVVVVVERVLVMEPVVVLAVEVAAEEEIAGYQSLVAEDVNASTLARWDAASYPLTLHGLLRQLLVAMPWF